MQDENNIDHLQSIMSGVGAQTLSLGVLMERCKSEDLAGGIDQTVATLLVQSMQLLQQAHITIDNIVKDVTVDLGGNVLNGYEPH